MSGSIGSPGLDGLYANLTTGEYLCPSFFMCSGEGGSMASRVLACLLDDAASEQMPNLPRWSTGVTVVARRGDESLFIAPTEGGNRIDAVSLTSMMRWDGNIVNGGFTVVPNPKVSCAREMRYLPIHPCAFENMYSFARREFEDIGPAILVELAVHDEEQTKRELLASANYDCLAAITVNREWFDAYEAVFGHAWKLKLFEEACKLAEEGQTLAVAVRNLKADRKATDLSQRKHYRRLIVTRRTK